MTAALTTAFMTALALLAFWRLPPLHPAQLWTAPWAMASLLFTLRLLPYRNLSTAGAVLLCLGSGAFVAGAVYGGRAAQARARDRLRDLPGLPLAACMAAAAAIALLCAFLIQATAEYGLRDALVPSPELRTGIESGTFAVTIKYLYFSLAAGTLFAFAAARAPDRAARRALLAAACCLAATSVFATGRATIVSAFVIVLVTYALARRKPTSRRAFTATLLGGACLAVAVLVAGGLVIGKTYENSSALRTTPSWFSEHPRASVLALPYQYASSPIAAFDVLVPASEPLGSAHGCATLTSACRALRQLGLPVQPVPAVRPFTAAPLRWNTYTALDLPLLDVGWLLLGPLLAALGWVVGRLWRAAHAGRPVAIAIYGICAAALVAASGSFAFFAPHLVGAALIALTCMRGAEKLAARDQLAPARVQR